MSSKHDSPTYTRWQGLYVWPEGYKGQKYYPQVYADNESEARTLAVKAFERLVSRHVTDRSWWIAFPIGPEGTLGVVHRFDPSLVSVEDIDLPLYTPLGFKIAPFPELDLSRLYSMNYDVSSK